MMISRAMAEGIARCGDVPVVRRSTDYEQPNTDVAIFYGLAVGLGRILQDYRQSGRKAVYCDLGYWTRRIRSRHDGYHKLAVNDRHPTDYFMRKDHTTERFERHGVPILPYRAMGRHILVAGMSAKAALAEQLKPNDWEERTIARLRELTNRPIIYRPKPNWTGASHISGSTMDRDTPLPVALRNCHAVVTHHSNVAIDALLAGVPVFCEKGAASILSSGDLSRINRPRLMPGRGRWAANLAWCQWNVREIKEGLAYQYLIDDGLIL